jgi:hypothetical protein
MMKHVLFGGVAVAALMLLSPQGTANAEGRASGGRTLGFLVTNIHIAQYETKFWDECPEGVNMGFDELWFFGLSQAERARQTQNGTLSHVDRKYIAHQRGPNKEDSCWMPTLFKNDPPLKVVQSKYGYGMNLDGEDTNESSASTCAHDNFENPTSGQKGIDNQLYRIMGCIAGWRRAYTRNVDNDSDQERRSSGRGLTLIEVSGVDNVQDDPEVSVRFFRSVDPPTRDSQGNVVPYSSYRIDVDVDGRARYGATARGRITKGTLTTEPLDVDLPYYGGESFGEINLRGMRLQLQVKPDASGFEGLMAGYYESEKWYWRMRDIEYLGDATFTSCPALYQAVQKYADGYRDPKTGKCTALSAAFNVAGVAAFVSHPKSKPSDQTASLDSSK